MSSRPDMRRATVARTPPTTARRTPPTAGTFVVAAAGVLLPFVLDWMHRIPHVVALASLAASLMALGFYTWDKRQARLQGQRTPENILHFLALSGGWPGALVAQAWLRHKTIKQPFRRVFWTTVVLNLVAIGWLASPAGQRLQGVLSVLR
jgi:uncharacterized membrane protein YsdA (DUF1294 family)